MRKSMSVVALALVIGLAAAASGQTILGPGLGSGTTLFTQTTNLHLTAGNSYVITGLFQMDSLTTLTIDPGVTVFVDSGGSSLIIRRGATINAVGTASNPIVFCGLKPAGSRAPGNMGGIVVLGRATMNQNLDGLIEGGIVPGWYGGANDADNSGTMQYVRIEFPGYRFALNNEINGLTMGAIGSGTTIDHVQVSYSFDDGFEWFGGNSKHKYLVNFGGTDDDFDTDFGWRGNLQFAFGMKDPNNWDPTGETNGFESDNESSASYDIPRTQCYFSNVTLLGPQRVDGMTAPSGNRHQFAMVHRRGTKNSVANSILAGFVGGLSIRDNQTYTSLTSGTGDSSFVRNVTLAVNNTWDATGQFPTFDGSSGLTDAQIQGYVAGHNINGGTGGTAADSIRNIGALALADLSNLNNPDPRPTGSSPAEISTVDFSFNSRPEVNNFFTTTTYRGAFDPALPMSSQWTAGWTNFDPQNTTNSNFFTGWNLASVPVNVASFAAGSVFPGNAGGPFSYDGVQYNAEATLNTNTGYWVFYTAPVSNKLVGTGTTTASTTTTGAKWVLIPSVGSPLPIARLTVTAGSGNIASSIFAYDGVSYVAADMIYPGKSYWVFVDGACTLTLQ